MQALASTHFGPDATKILKLVSNVPIPEPLGPTEVRIQVAYSELNPVDLHKLAMKPEGTPVPDHRNPFIVGFGGSGIIDKVGWEEDENSSGNSSNLKKGDRVAFLCDSSKDGSYAEYVIVDYRMVASIPDGLSLSDAAAAPLAGCTAFESLEKIGLTLRRKNNDNNDEINSKERTLQKESLLIIGGAGGVGSWCTILARHAYPDLNIICTASSPQSKEWCKTMGANDVIGHDSILNSLEGGRNGSVKYIICLTEPTKELFASMAEVLKPFGKICLVVSGESIKSLDLSFIFFKSGSVCTETVFSNCRSGFVNLDQSDQIQHLMQVLLLMKNSSSSSSPLNGMGDWTEALEDCGIIKMLGSGHTRGKLVMKISNNIK